MAPAGLSTSGYEWPSLLDEKVALTEAVGLPTNSTRRTRRGNGKSVHVNCNCFLVLH